MKLTRRDALVALLGGTAATATIGGGAEFLDRPTDRSLEEAYVERLRAVAEVVYPSEVDASPEFVESYVFGRIADREEYRDGVVGALDAVESASQHRYREPMTALTESDVDDLLREMGVATAYPVPGGTTPERVRYYVVNDLLYALYASPVGGRLVGYENPDGYPGGTEAYQRGPDA